MQIEKAMIDTLDRYRKTDTIVSGAGSARKTRHGIDNTQENPSNSAVSNGGSSSTANVLSSPNCML